MDRKVIHGAFGPKEFLFGCQNVFKIQGTNFAAEVPSKLCNFLEGTSSSVALSSRDLEQSAEHATS